MSTKERVVANLNELVWDMHRLDATFTFTEMRMNEYEQKQDELIESYAEAIVEMICHE
jgi:hypothetical protein